MRTSPADRRWDVAVIGAGPAGLSAAVAAAAAGASVVLIDSEPVAGGQYWRHPADPAAAAAAADLHHGLDRYRSLLRSVDHHRASRRLEHLPLHEVWSVGGQVDRFELQVVDRTAARPTERSVHAATLVLATGAYDLQVPFPGWDLPGVLTAGGAQSLLKGHGVVAGSRIVVAGTGPFLLPVAAGLAVRGAKVVGVYEAAGPAGWRSAPNVAAVLRNAGKLGEGAGYAAQLVRHRVPYRTRSTVISAHGTKGLEAVTVAPLDRTGRPMVERSRWIEVDTLAVGWGFVPQLELALALHCSTTVGADAQRVVLVDDDQRTDVPGVFVAGEACGVGGAALAAGEGAVAGAIAGGGTAPARLRRRIAAQRTFARAMARVYPVPTHWIDGLTPDTVVCRCEEVSAGTLRAVVDRDDVIDARSAKLLVRNGMGWCQGRVCGYPTDCLTAAWSGRAIQAGPGTRPVAAPVPLGLVARTPRP